MFLLLASGNGRLLILPDLNMGGNKMKISRFTTIVRKEGYYLLHNTLFNSIMRVYGEKSRSFIDSIEDGRTFNMDENSPFLCALKN